MNKPTNGVTRKRAAFIAWTVSIVLNLLALWVFWSTPALRQQILAFDVSKEEQSQEDRETQRAEIERRMAEKRERTPIDDATREKIAQRLEQERIHRVVQRIREMKQIHEQLVERSAEKWEDYRQQMSERPERKALETLQREMAALIERQEAMASRLENVAGMEENKDRADELKNEAQAYRDAAKETAEIADQLETIPGDQDAEQLRELLTETGTRAESTANDAADLTTKDRAEALASSAAAVEKALEAAREKAGTAAEVPPPPAPPAVSDTVEHIAKTGEVESLEKAYEAASELEQAIAGAYDENRVVDMARLAEIDEQTARDRVIPSQVAERANPFAETAEAAAAEGDSAADSWAGEAAAMDIAERQVADMLTSAQSRLAMADGIQQPGEDAQQRSGQMFMARQQLSEAAASRRRMVDVSAMMMAAMGYEGEGGSDVQQTEETRRADSPPQRRPRALPPSSALNALPGRRFSRDSLRKGWLYLDTWYVIGPWQNHDLENFQPAHPPEQAINFDDTYPGRIYTQAEADHDRRRKIQRGFDTGQPRPLRWRFTQSDGARVIVPDQRDNSTYYLYTEVYFEQAEEMIVAVGTDDAGKIWINNLHIGQDTGLTAWRIDETLRRVWFKQGYNTILVRLENGPTHAEMSFLICPANSLN